MVASVAISWHFGSLITAKKGIEMDGRKKLEAQPESKKDPNDDEIIDLEQVIKKENDDDIIDLTHVLEQPDTKTNDENRMTEADDTIIELSAPMITVNNEDAGNDEVIDLEGMETTFEADLSGSSTSDDEDILDLLDTVESDDLSDPTRPLDETSDADDVIEEDEDMQDDVIDLMDAVPPVLPSGGVDETAESVPPAMSFPLPHPIQMPFQLTRMIKRTSQMPCGPWIKRTFSIPLRPLRTPRLP